MTNTLLHPFSPPSMPEDDYIDIVRGEGSLIFDATGKDYVDGMANLWLCQVGHGRTEIIDAVTTQMHQIEAYNTFAPFTNGPAAQVAEMIVERSPHPDGRVFLGSSGSEAVDTALKFARQIQQRRGQEGRQIVVKRTNGYHGTNFGGTSAQGIAPNREGWGDLVPHFLEVPHDDLEMVASIFAEQGDRIAAVLTEPVQGAGGVFPPVDGYLEGLRRLCDDNGALLVFDEVICGFGRTGKWFGAQTFDVTPDLITFAKGVTSGYLPLSGVIMSRSVCEEFDESGFLLRTGYTYSGHQTSCAAGIANLQIMTNEGLHQRANHVGEKLREGLSALQADGLIESWRGMGAIYAAELGRDAIPVRNAILEAGVILRPIGTCLAICPPLVITDAELGRIIDTMASVLG
ncbi:MAG: aminotransferase class III-fold pyridoxal phosphate-dependent enzyme [Acidimicrobiales bacterium]|nr:aminotransferase class III-fold pyridoxal phosphate-dependent enzyme [Acidimicrobiales bacterium]